MESSRVRGTSGGTLVMLLALSAALTAFVVAFRRDAATSGPVAEHADQPVAAWRLLPTEEDLPDGWSVTSGNVNFTGGAGVNLRGPERLSGYLLLLPSEGGEAGARQWLKDLRDSANALPGRARVDAPTLGDESLAFREVYPSHSGEGPEAHALIMVWRRGALLVQLRIQDFGPIGLDRSPSRPVDLQRVVDLANRIDAALADGPP